MFLDAYYAGSDGTPVHIPNTFCIFERYAGDIMWRHTEIAIPDEVVTFFYGILVLFTFFPVDKIFVVFLADNRG